MRSFLAGSLDTCWRLVPDMATLRRTTNVSTMRMLLRKCLGGPDIGPKHLYHTRRLTFSPLLGRREYAIGHALWCCGQALQVQLLHSSSPSPPVSPSNPNPAISLHFVLAIFLRFFLRGFPGFPAGYRIFPCLWAPTVNTQSARQCPLP